MLQPRIEKREFVDCVSQCTVHFLKRLISYANEQNTLLSNIWIFSKNFSFLGFIFNGLISVQLASQKEKKRIKKPLCSAKALHMKKIQNLFISCGLQKSIYVFKHLHSHTVKQNDLLLEQYTLTFGFLWNIHSKNKH